MGTVCLRTEVKERGRIRGGKEEIPGILAIVLCRDAHLLNKGQTTGQHWLVVCVSTDLGTHAAHRRRLQPW